MGHHHQNHFNGTYANNDHMDNGNSTLNGTNRQLCCRNKDDNQMQNHNDYELNKLIYSNSSHLLDISSCESHMQYHVPDYATPFNEFSLHYKSLRAEYETLKTQNALLREELEKFQKVDRIVMVSKHYSKLSKLL